MRLAPISLMALALASPLEAQTPREPTPGSQVRVVAAAEGRAWRGKLVSLRGDTVVIADSIQRNANGRITGYEPRERTFALGQHTQLQMLTGSRSHARTGALIGGGLGFAAGATFGYASAALSDNLRAGRIPMGAMIAGGILIGVPGALLGAALGRTAKWATVATRGVTVGVIAPDSPRRPSGRFAMAIQVHF